MKFIALDFETANMRKSSICQVGITSVDNGVVAEAKTWLVNPDSFFDRFNVKIHGITEDMVKGSPLFRELWPEIVPYFNEADFVVAHNARFDICALDEALELNFNPYSQPFAITIPSPFPKKPCDQVFDFELPDFKFACSIAMARRTWGKEPSYSLQALCNLLNIEYGNHDAGADSRSCAELTIKIFQEKGIDLFMDINSDEKLLALEELLQIYFGSLSREGFSNSTCRHLPYKPSITKRKDIVGNVEKINSDSIFYQKNVVFTGTLSSMTRNEALQIIADIGGFPSNGITSITNVLVVGQQDFRVVGESGMSSKQKKAIEMKNKGLDIEIVTEDDFMKNL
jgi:DNA polymerase-3 subunit epsilon